MFRTLSGWSSLSVIAPLGNHLVVKVRVKLDQCSANVRSSTSLKNKPEMIFIKSLHQSLVLSRGFLYACGIHLNYLPRAAVCTFASSIYHATLPYSELGAQLPCKSTI